MDKGLVLNLDDCLVSEESINRYEKALGEGQKRLESGDEEFTGWVRLPLEYDRNEISRIKQTAEKIREQCDIFIVTGIGGSYLGARAGIEMAVDTLTNPEICYAGHNISGTYHSDLMNKIKDKDICICIISKSGTTTEPGIAFALLKDLLVRKYGREEANRRIYSITDESKGILREETEREGYTSFVVPDDIGGRYSVLTAVGLLPLAVAGIDIDAVLDGAAAEASLTIMECSRDNTNWLIEDGPARLAAVRNELFTRGKSVEVFEYYEPRLQFFSEWLKQLFGESEGKGGKGIFPAALQFSTDLHSMGQFLQEGHQIFFETVLNVVKPDKDLIVPESAGGILAGQSMNKVNMAAVEGVMAAHRAAGIPMIRLDIPGLNAYSFGRMVYFFERACALSGYLMGVDPFDQPGVESYKSEMRKVLQK